MVNVVHLSDKWAVIHDNNYPGKYLWMDRNAFIQRWKEGGGWSVVLLDPPPPPIPVNTLTLQDWYRLRDLYERSVGYDRFGPSADTYELPEDSEQWLSPISIDDLHGWQVHDDDGYRWRFVTGDPDHVYLYRTVDNGKTFTQAGGYDMNRQVYMTLTNGTWTEGECPVYLPLQKKTNKVDVETRVAAKIGGKNNHGIDVDALTLDTGYESVDGQRVTADDTLKAVAVKPKFFVTYVGTDKTDVRDFLRTTKVLANVAVHAYTADAWEVTGVGMAPGVTVQRWSPTGTSPVLFRTR